MIKPKPFKEETANRKRIDAVVNKRIRSTAELAYRHSQFWKKKFDQLKMKPEDVNDQESLLNANRKGLRITRDELIKEFPLVVTDLAPNDYIEEIWTSGSTGLPKRVWYSKDDLKRSSDQCRFLFNAMGLSAGDYVLNMFSPDPNASGPLSKEAAKDLGLHMLHMSVPLPPDKLVHILKTHKPKSLWALSTKAYQLPRLIEGLGEKSSSFGIDTILTGGEHYTKERKNVIKKDWNAEIIDCWASAELSVFGYQAIGCNADVMHVPENRIFLNFADPKTLDLVSDEEKGVDLVSTLYDIDEKPATILLGYSHNDSGRLIDSKKCDCGRTFKKIEWPVFRNDYIVHMVGQNVYPVSGTESAISDSPFLTGEYLTIYKETSGPRRRPYLEVRVESSCLVPENEKEKLEEKLLSYIISNPAAHDIVTTYGDLIISFVDKGCLFKDYEKFIKPGKPIRLIKL